MINAVVFDIVNVLANYEWENYFRHLGFDEEMSMRVAKATLLGDDWKEYDRGVLSQEEILKLFCENDPEISYEIQVANRNFEGLVTKRDYAIPWICALKKAGFQVYYLSNYSEKAEKDCADALDFIPYTDGGILSWREGVYKPQPQIYELLTNRFHLQNNNCVFLDDTMDNLLPAQKLGFHTIHFQNPRQAKMQLEQLGVFCEFDFSSFNYNSI